MSLSTATISDICGQILYPPISTFQSGNIKVTDYFKYVSRRPDRRQIKREWIQRVVDYPEKRHIQKDGRWRLWGEFPEAEGRDLDEDTIIDLDADGSIVAMTMEHARNRTDAPNLTFEEIAA